MLKPKY